MPAPVSTTTRRAFSIQPRTSHAHARSLNWVAMQLGDLQVNRLGFGAMRVCGPQVWGPPRDRAAGAQVLRRAYELGHNFFDTADSYGPEVDEILIAEALHPYPKDLVIGTKGGLLRPSPPRGSRTAGPSTCGARSTAA